MAVHFFAVCAHFHRLYAILVGDVLNKASRYVLRVSRSVVVSLNLSRRNAASESEEKAVVARDSWLLKARHYTRIGYG